MKSSKIGYIALLVYLICLGSCVQEEIMPYSSSDSSKLVVLGFLSPGENVNVYIGKTQPFGKQSYQPSDFTVNKAIVTISDENGLIKNLTLSHNSASIYSCSQNDFPIVPGKSYTLKVRSDSFAEVNAFTTVPSEAAKWKTTTFSGPENYYYYTFSGIWDALEDNSHHIDYGVNLITSNSNPTERSNENITQINALYTVKRDIYLPQASSFKAVLITRDKAFSEFSRKSDLTFDVIENLKSAAFTDIISGFKGIIPDAGNIKGGTGVFGSYLKDEKTINK